MKTVPHPRTGEGVAALGVLMLVVLEVAALSAAPARDRPVVGGALVGAAASAFIVVGALWHHYRRTAVRRVRGAGRPR
ncbi:hypothetical protein [Actinacidiphila oryziradicis]|uniref:DUF2530 domain-containing protein n=1 Tax=Actinacidiphila oryziradicis TaxID=2571141 RepID=A0A4U0S041_9ACTN|nr:hypothetical protein [Actinacidiphila oryziradicis]TKA01393.1 hypothetical protein FCI23_40680 [Actinacidiphila oryziradicis]